jgi:hypothetical protein
LILLARHIFDHLLEAGDVLPLSRNRMVASSALRASASSVCDETLIWNLFFTSTADWFLPTVTSG